MTAAHERARPLLAQQLPVKKVGQPGDIASAILMLMMNEFATGSIIDIDGGGLLT